MSQKAELLRLMRFGRVLTRVNAWKLTGCLRLSARILELRQDGHQIETFHRRHNGTNIVMYRLKDSP